MAGEARSMRVTSNELAAKVACSFGHRSRQRRAFPNQKTDDADRPLESPYWGMHLTPEAPRSSIRALEDYSRTLGSFKSASPSGFKVNRCRPPAGRNERRL